MSLAGATVHAVSSINPRPVMLTASVDNRLRFDKMTCSGRSTLVMAVTSP